MAPPRRKGSVGQFVATMSEPTKRRIEMCVVDMERSQLARLKVVPTMPKKEACVSSMGQSIKRAKHAAMMDVQTLPEKEAFVPSIGQRSGQESTS